MPVPVYEMQIYKVHVDDHIRVMTEILKKECKELNAALKNLQYYPNVAMEHAREAKACENKMEKEYRTALGDLFEGNDPVYMLKMREIYRHLSNAADRGDEAANSSATSLKDDLIWGVYESLFVAEGTRKGEAAKIAIRLKDSEISFGELYRLTDSFGTALHRAGIGLGDHVTLMLPNIPEFVITYMAVIGIGAVVTPVNPSYTSRELRHILPTPTPRPSSSNIATSVPMGPLPGNPPGKRDHNRQGGAIFPGRFRKRERYSRRQGQGSMLRL